MNINVALYSYTRAFGDRSHNFEPWSSDEDNNGVGITSPNYDTNGRTFELSTDLRCIAPLHGGSLVVLGVTSSSPVPLKTRRVGERCTLNLSRAQTSSCWNGEVVKRGQLKYRPRHLTMVQNYEVRLQKPYCS
ncbi:uncharacterized protein TNCV_1272611 [Trichonephila clavipes]|nr:uncharacterized protein TNCV_1272611 [Trichonephila clavipes]